MGKSLAGDIHIFNKQAVAHRLAVAARHVVYGEDKLVYSGPRVTSVSLQDKEIVLTYGVGTEGGGLKLRSKFGFEVCSTSCEKAGAKWTKVDVSANTARTVTLRTVSATVAVIRYAHVDAPSLFTGNQLAVYNAEGLPATPGVYKVNSSVDNISYDLGVQGHSVTFGDDAYNSGVLVV